MALHRMPVICNASFPLPRSAVIPMLPFLGRLTENDDVELLMRVPADPVTVSLLELTEMDTVLAPVSPVRVSNLALEL